MSILLKIMKGSDSAADEHKTFPDSQYRNAQIVMQSWAKQPEVSGCALFLMSDDVDHRGCRGIYSVDWVELDRMEITTKKP